MELSETRRLVLKSVYWASRGSTQVNPDKKYALKSIPGKEFTGLQLLAYMYAAFQVIDPFLDTSLDFKKEYEQQRNYMKKNKTEIEEIADRLIKFRNERNWEQFHNSKESGIGAIDWSSWIEWTFSLEKGGGCKCRKTQRGTGGRHYICLFACQKA